MINAQINHSIETMVIGLEMDLSTIRMKTGETLEIFLVIHRLKGEPSHKMFFSANEEVFLPTIPLSAYLTFNQRLVSHPMNKNSHETKARRHLMWFASPQPTIPSLHYQTLAR